MSELTNSLLSGGINNAISGSDAVGDGNVFGDSVASGSGNLQMVRKIAVTKGKSIGMKYSKVMCLDLHLIDYTRMETARLLPPFVIMMEVGRCCYDGAWRLVS